MYVMLAVTLAAERGTRMGRLTEGTPTTLLSRKDRPIVEHSAIGTPQDLATAERAL